MRARTRARGRALQLLYAWESRGAADPPTRRLEGFLAERRLAPEVRAYLERLIGAVAEHRTEIDRALVDSLTNWRLERLASIDRNILRIAAAEMLYIADVPPRVSIQEAILLAERFGSKESPRFVNGVLDALMRESERAGNGGSEGS